MCSRAFGARHPLLGVTHNLENNLKVATAVGVLVAGVGVVVVLKVVEVVVKLAVILCTPKHKLTPIILADWPCWLAGWLVG